MESSTAFQTRPKITPKITRISSLVQSADRTKKSSAKLLKIFEKGTYQKKTQLSILNRYKRRLESIQKQNDKKFTNKQRVKIKLPEIKKFTGGFFTSTADPLKSIGSLAAFNALRKGAKGDVMGALGPALVAAGIFFGPSLLKGGIGAAMNRGGKVPPTPEPATTSSPRSLYSQTSAGRAYSGMQAERNLPRWAQRSVGGSASRYNESYARNLQGEANIGDRARLLSRRVGFKGIGGVSEGIAAKGVGVPKVGLLNAALFGLDFLGRKGSGQTNLQAGVGAGAGLGGALIGAAIGTALFPGAGTVAGFLIGAAFSGAGAWIGSSIADKLTGVDKLGKLTERQKKLIETQKKSDGQLTFSKTLNSYERVVNKFYEFSKTFKSANELNDKFEGGNSNPPTTPTSPYTGPVGGDSFWPLPGGVLTPGGGMYGAERNYDGGHSGQDIGGLPGRSPVAAWKTGTVTVSPGLEGPDHIITIDHGNGDKSVYKHVIATVRNGEIVYGGQQIAVLLPGREEVGGRRWDTHLHFEVWRGGRHVNPNLDLSASQRIPSPLSRQRAMETFQTNSTEQIQSNVFNLELHHPEAGGRPGLIESLLSPGTDSISSSLRSTYGSYARGFRDLGGPKRGLNLIELDNSRGVDYNAQRLFNIIKANPGTQFNLFAGHTDVAPGSGGLGAPGEQEFVKSVAGRVMQLSSSAGLRNVTYHRATARVSGTDPRANWNVAQRLWNQSMRGGTMTPTFIPVARQPMTGLNRNLPYQQQSPQQVIVQLPSQKKSPVVVQDSGSSGMIIGPSEDEMLNSFYKRILLNTLQ